MRDPEKITAENYKSAFLALENAGKITKNQIAMLKTHCNAPDHIIDAQKLAKAVRYKSYHGANLQYGLLAKRIAEKVGYQRPKGRTCLSTLVTFKEKEGDASYPMELRPNAVKALKQIEWV